MSYVRYKKLQKYWKGVPVSPAEFVMGETRYDLVDYTSDDNCYSGYIPPEETRWVEVGNPYCDGDSLVVLMKEQHKVNDIWVDFEPEVTKVEIIELESDECRGPKSNCFTYEPTSTTGTNHIWFNGRYNSTRLSGTGYDCYEGTITRIQVDSTALTSVDLSDMDTSELTKLDFSSGYQNDHIIESINVTGFNTSKVTNMASMFKNNPKLKSLDLSTWNVSNSTSFNAMFYRCRDLTSLNLTGWDTSSATDMKEMFYYCDSLPSLVVSHFNTSNVTDMSSMFEGCYELAPLDLSSFDTSNVTDMSRMFLNCHSLETLDLSNFDTSNVTVMYGMFENCYNLTSLNLSNFDTSNLKFLSDMFHGCYNLTSLDLSSFDTRNVTQMYGTFYNCTSLTSLDLSNFNTSNVTDIRYMFYNDSSNPSKLRTLDLSGWDLRKVQPMYYRYVFVNCVYLETIYARGCNSATIKILNEIKPSGTTIVTD